MGMSSFNKQLNNKTSCNFPSFFFPQNKYFSLFEQESLWVGLVVVVPIKEYLIFIKSLFSLLFPHFELSSHCFVVAAIWIVISYFYFFKVCHQFPFIVSHPFLLLTISVSHLSPSASTGFPLSSSSTIRLC